MTRNVSTLSNDKKAEFKQTAQLGMSHHQLSASALNQNVQAQIKIKKGLNIISKMTNKRIKFLQSSSNKKDKKKGVCGSLRLSTIKRNSSNGRTVSNKSDLSNNVTRSLSQSDTSNNTSIWQQKISQTYGTYRKCSPTLSSIE